VHFTGRLLGKKKIHLLASNKNQNNCK